MENGETKPQIMARSRHIILMHKSKWNAQQQARAAILFSMFPRLEQAYNIYLELVDIFNRKSKPAEARLNLARWYNKVEAFGDDGFSKVIETFENHNATIINYFEDIIRSDIDSLTSVMEGVEFVLLGSVIGGDYARGKVRAELLFEDLDYIH